MLSDAAPSRNNIFTALSIATLTLLVMGLVLGGIDLYVMSETFPPPPIVTKKPQGPELIQTTGTSSTDEVPQPQPDSGKPGTGELPEPVNAPSPAELPGS